MIISSTQILVPTFYFPLKEPRFLGEMPDYKTSSRNVQDESKILVVPVKKKTNGNMSKAH